MKLLKNRFFLIAVGIFLIFFVAISFSSQTTPSKTLAQASPTPSLQSSPALVAKQEVKGSSVSAALGNPENNMNAVLVTKVIDGDTIQIATGQTVRYIGMNTPETVDPRRAPQCFGKEASVKNKELVLGKKVILEKDVSETDKYGRLLRYVYVPLTEGKSGTVFVNYELVVEGYAYASAYPPDVRYQDQFSSAQTQARENNRGLWAGCPLSP